MEFKKEGSVAPVLEFSNKTATSRVESTQYRVVSTGVRAADSGSPSSNFKTLARVLKAFSAAGMPAETVVKDLPPDQGYVVNTQVGVVSLASTEPRSGINVSTSRVVLWEMVPDTGYVLPSGQSADSNVIAFPSQLKGSQRLNMLNVEPITLPELEKAA